MKKRIVPMWLDQNAILCLPYVLCINEEDFTDFLASNLIIYQEKWISDIKVATTHCIKDPLGESLVVICIKGGLDILNVISTLVHEATHVYQYTMDHIGESTPGIETEAYFVEHISITLINDYLRQTRQTLKAVEVTK